jgi:hypothetical protein
LLRSPPVPGKFNYRWLGPYVVIEQISPLSYRIKLPDASETVVVHVNRLKRSPPPESSNQGPVEKPLKRRGRPRKLAGHPKKAKVVPELRRPMTVIPMEVTDPPKERRGRGRPRKRPTVTHDEAPPKRRVTESDHVTYQNEYQWRPQSIPLGMPGFQQGFCTVPPSLYNSFAQMPQNSDPLITQWPTQTLNTQQVNPSFTRQANNSNRYHNQQQEIPRYNLRQCTKPGQRF